VALAIPDSTGAIVWAIVWGLVAVSAIALGCGAEGRRKRERAEYRRECEDLRRRCRGLEDELDAARAILLAREIAADDGEDKDTKQGAAS